MNKNIIMKDGKIPVTTKFWVEAGVYKYNKNFVDAIGRAFRNHGFLVRFSPRNNKQDFQLYVKKMEYNPNEGWD